MEKEGGRRLSWSSPASMCPCVHIREKEWSKDTDWGGVCSLTRVCREGCWGDSTHTVFREVRDEGRSVLVGQCSSPSRQGGASLAPATSRDPPWLGHGDRQPGSRSPATGWGSGGGRRGLPTF